MTIHDTSPGLNFEAYVVVVVVVVNVVVVALLAIGHIIFSWG